MNTWETLIHLTFCKIPASYLRLYADIWNIEVRSIVEIGVYRGEGSRNLRVAFPDAFVYLIDPWEPYEDECAVSDKTSDFEEAYKGTQELFKNDLKVKIIRKPSIEALEDTPRQVDLVFIDGNHTYKEVKQDIKYWFPKVRPGGIISGHDYDTCFPGVIQAVDESFPDASIGYHKTWVWQIPS